MMKQEKRKRIIQLLRENGYRLTSQRKLILNIILEDECCSCKEIYYKVLLRDSSVGIATVYRMINTLEDLGAIDRKNMYHICCDQVDKLEPDEAVLIDQDKVIPIAKENWYRELLYSLRKNGYLKDEKLSIIIKKEHNKKGGIE